MFRRKHFCFLLPPSPQFFISQNDGNACHSSPCVTCSLLDLEQGTFHTNMTFFLPTFSNDCSLIPLQFLLPCSLFRCAADRFKKNSPFCPPLPPLPPSDPPTYPSFFFTLSSSSLSCRRIHTHELVQKP